MSKRHRSPLDTLLAFIFLASVPNPRLDALLDDGAANPDQQKRRADYVEAQQILARELPAINLWYRDTVVVHNRRLTRIVPTPSGSFKFLETAELTN
jgi:peptide/nickel transport system substrate-binding protein